MFNFYNLDKGKKNTQAKYCGKKGGYQLVKPKAPLSGRLMAAQAAQYVQLKIEKYL